MNQLLVKGFASLGLDLDDKALSRFELYYKELIRVNEVMNLTSITEPKDVATKHFLDSAILLTLPYIKNNSRIIDIGSGAGFPGLPMKIIRPSIKLTMIDALNKRIGFLTSVCKLLGFDDIECVHARAEDFIIGPARREAYDIAVSRAVADLSVLCEFCLPYVKPGGYFLAMKGPSPEDEIENAKSAIKILSASVVETIKLSIPNTDIVHSVIVIKKEKAGDKKYPRSFAKITKNPL